MHAQITGATAIRAFALYYFLHARYLKLASLVHLATLVNVRRIANCSVPLHSCSENVDFKMIYIKMSATYDVCFKVLCFLTICLICWINFPTLNGSYHLAPVPSRRAAADTFAGTTSALSLAAPATARESTVTRQRSSLRLQVPHGSSGWTTINLGSNLFVYGTSAFYDRRTRNDSGQHNVRMVLVTTCEHLQILRKSNITCALNDQRNKVWESTARWLEGYQRTLKVSGATYKSFMLSCPVNQSPATNQIISVALFMQPTSSTDTSLPVVYPVVPGTNARKNDVHAGVSYQHEFGMCLGGGTMYGEVNDADARWLVEWFEVNRMFGVTEFNLYNATAQFSDKAKAVIQFYQKIGVLKFHQLPPPLTHYDVNDRNAVDLSMRVSLNECMYTNMYRYKYIVVIDLDEIIVPYTTRD